MSYALKYPDVVRWLLVVDFLVNISLWIIGGFMQIDVKEIDQIIHFNFTQSIFDLIIVNSIKTILLFILITELENLSNESAWVRRQEKSDERVNDTTSDTSPLDLEFKPKTSNYFNMLKRLESLILIMLSLSSLVYQVIKFSMIVYKRSLHGIYFASIIVSMCFALIEFLLLCVSGKIMQIYEAHLIDQSKETQENVKKRVNLSRLLSLSKPERFLLSLGFISLVVSSVSSIITPYYFGKIIDAAQNYADLSEMNRYVVLMFLIYVGGSVASGVRSWLFEYSGQRVVARLRRDVFNAILKQDIKFFDTNRTGELTSRISSDTQVLQNAVTVNISMLLRYLIQILGSLVFMFSLQVELTGILLAIIPVVSLLTVYYGRFLRKLRKEFQDNLALANVTAEESISSARTVRSFAAEDKITRVYETEINKSFKIGARLAAAQGGFMFVVGLLTAFALTVVIWYGGKLVHNHKLTTGILASFLMYTLQVAMAFAFLMSIFGDFMQAVGASQRIFELLDTKPDISLNEGYFPKDSNDDEMTFDGSLQIKNVSFSYPTRKETLVLQDLTIKIERNQTVALVGPSGGGKSTIFSLIERYYDPNEGEITVGQHGIKLKTLNLNYFHRCMALVSQEPVLFGGSIKDNILFGVPDSHKISLDEIVEVAKLANAHNFINDFEKGYDTLVGERGVRLSGGQKQRIAIARALLVKPKLLLLDEATSALDSESEHLVQEAMNLAMKDRTVCVIAHRLSTVRNANLVIVLDGGKIVESGTHDELIALNGIYKKLVLRQMLTKKDEILLE